MRYDGPRMGHDVVCVGEALVDFLPDRPGRLVREVKRWRPCLGGAPANVAVGVARLGGRSALVGVTGSDEFGCFLKDGLAAEGVDVSWLRQTEEGKTGLGFVSLTRAGERSFSFYRTRAAETFLSPADTGGAAEPLARAKVVHFGTNSLVQAPAREAVQAALERAQAAGRITSCDPNLRLHLWPEPAALRGLLDALVPRCAVFKLSDEECGFVTDRSDAEGALAALEARGVLLPVVTLGAKGAALRFKGRTAFVPAPPAKVVDTTGAGDGFTTGLLWGLTRLYGSREALARAEPAALEALARFACVVGAFVVRRLGAVAGLPRRRQVARALPACLRS